MMLDIPAQATSEYCTGVKNAGGTKQHEPHVMPLRNEPHAGDGPHATLRPQTEPIEVPSPRLRPTARKPRRAPLCDAGPAEVMKLLALDGGAEWKTMGASPLAAAHELLDGDEAVDDCAVCGGSLFQPADDDDEGPFAMSPPKLSPRVVCRCPPARPGG